MPEEAKQRGQCIVLTPHLFYEAQPWGSIPKSNPYFVERCDKLVELEVAFSMPSQGGVVVIEPFRNYRQSQVNLKTTLAQGIVGLGGVGKTQLAAEYVYRLCDEEVDKEEGAKAQQQAIAPLQRRYALKLWLRGEKILLQEDLRKLSAWLGLASEPNTSTPTIAQRVYERLASLSLDEASPRVLLILDDGQWEEGLRELLPAEQYRHRFHWLLTSREQSVWKAYFGQSYHSCQLGVFSEKEVEDYFEKAFSVPVKERGDDYTKENREELARQLGYLPLALAQAVAYINQQCHRGEGIQDYLTVLKQRGLHLDPDQAVEDYTRPVITTWLISLPRLLAESPTAVELLLACSYLTGTHIPHRLLRAYKKDIKGENAVIKATVLKAVECLVNYSLLEDISSQAVKMHALLQEVLRTWLNGALLTLVEQKAIRQEIERIDKIILEAGVIKPAVLSILVESLTGYAEEFVPTVVDRQRRIDLISHFESVITWCEAINPQDETSQKTLLSLYYQLGYIQLYLRVDAKAGMRLYQRQLELGEKHYGSGHPLVAVTLMHLGNAYGRLGNVKQQKALQERALRIQEHYLGHDHPVLALTLMNLANAYGHLGNAERQKALLKWALAIQKQHYDDDHPAVAATLTNLGNAYYRLGNVQKQKALLEQALHIKERYYGLGHPELVATLVSLGAACSNSDNAQKQKALLEQALSIQERYYGLDHPEVATILTNLSGAYCLLGNVKQQKALLERALSIVERYYGSNQPPMAAIILINLAKTYGKLGDVQQEKSLLERALGIQECNYGLDHLEVARTCINLGIICGDMGDNYQKKTLLERALLVKRRHYGPDHVEVAQVLFNLSHAELSLDSPNTALEYAQQCLRILKHSCEEIHDYIPLTENLISKCKVVTQINALKLRYKVAVEDNSPQAAAKLFRCAAVEGELMVLQEYHQNRDVPLDSQDTNLRIRRTALHWACLKQRTPVMIYLLSQGARFDIEDAEGKMAWEYVLDTSLLADFRVIADEKFLGQYDIKILPNSTYAPNNPII